MKIEIDMEEAESIIENHLQQAGLKLLGGFKDPDKLVQFEETGQKDGFYRFVAFTTIP